MNSPVEEVKQDLEQGGPQPAGPDRGLEWHVKELQAGNATLLSNLTGRVNPGDFLVILGPSGAGKSSLLECLCLRNRNFVGALHWHGKPVTSDYYMQAAMVYQEELLFTFLTPREHLTFHATARLQHCTTKQRADRVQSVLESLDLIKCADTIIGGTEVLHEVKGISGGERKRVCIATELLISPSVLFLDEPTSGLDSYMAEGVVRILKALAERGVMVVSSMHAPSSTLAQHFSHLLLLTPDGRAAYHGPYDQAGAYFSSIGRPIPSHLLACDYMIWMVSRRDDPPEAHTRRLDDLVAALDSSPGRPVPLPVETGHQNLTHVSGRRTSMSTYIGLNLWRSSIRITRQTLPIGFMLGTFTVLGLLFGVLYYHQVSNNWRSMMGSLFLAANIVMMVSGVPCMLVTCIEWPRLSREYLSGSNSLSAALMGYFLLHTPYLLGPVIFATLVYWMGGFLTSLATYLQFVGIILLIDLASTSISIWMGVLCPSPAACLALAPALLAPMVVFSGVLYQRSAVPWYLSWLHDISIINFGYASLLGSQVQALPPAGRQVVLRFSEVNPADTGRSCLVLALMTLVYSALICLTINLRLRITKLYK